MIVSASRRTDIPAFFSNWFLNRLREEAVLVRNPQNPQKVSRVRLNREHIDCIVFWTKNPAPMLQNLEQLKDYPFYFLFTLTAYGNELERELPPVKQIIETFYLLSRVIGKERVIWRYDPIILTDHMDENYHYENFELLARKLENHTEKCIVSFIDMYNKCKRNLAGFSVKLPGESRMVAMIHRLNVIAQRHGISLHTCAETTDFSGVCAGPAKCIDPELIARITGKKMVIPKDKNQRKSCACVESIDVGAYDTCSHHCLYCYANNNGAQVKKNISQHREDSPLLIGQLWGNETVTDRQITTYPLSLF